MQKLEAAVIHMEKNLDKVEFLIGDKIEFNQGLLNEKSLGLFSIETLDFLSDISEVLFKSPQIRNFPDVASFAFFCRRSNLHLLKRNYINSINSRIGRGILFHIAPGNVPVNFAYSLFAGLVTGNINIVKLPSKNFEQVGIIINAIKNVLFKEKFNIIFSKRLYLLKYDRDTEVTSFFSKLCDIRIIWGGDQTINEIRKSQIPPKSTEITFSDRYSIALFNAKNYLDFDDKLKLATDFYNDTYLFDQNACTAPQTIFWFGSIEEINTAKSLFWKILKQKLNKMQYEVLPIISVDKLVTFYSQAINQGDIKLETTYTSEIWRVANYSIHNDMNLFKCGSGYFNEYNISKLDEILPAINRKYQTLSYFGFQKEYLTDWIMSSKPLGIDRIVPVGKTMDFSLTWDGYDLVNSMSRIIYI
jgi:hypothetical protein